MIPRQFLVAIHFVVHSSLSFCLLCSLSSFLCLFVEVLLSLLAICHSSFFSHSPDFYWSCCTLFPSDFHSLLRWFFWIFFLFRSHVSFTFSVLLDARNPSISFSILSFYHSVFFYLILICVDVFHLVFSSFAVAFLLSFHCVFSSFIGCVFSNISLWFSSICD